MKNEDIPPQIKGNSNKNWLDKVSQMFGHREPQNQDDLQEVINKANEESIISEDTREMIQGVLDVSTMKVRDVMIPRSQITAIEKDAPLNTILSIIIKHKHSRFPVISDDKDHIEGLLLTKDLLPYAFDKNKEFKLDDVIRPAVVVPEGKRVDILLKEFREERYHMAMVVDEYGSVSGLITIEDILEEIVGDIEDEHDEEEQKKIRQLSKNAFYIDALTEIDDFNKEFETTLPEDEFDTIGGLIASTFGYLPERGEKVEIEGINFEVTASDTRRLSQLKVTLNNGTAEEDLAEEA